MEENLKSVDCQISPDICFRPGAIIREGDRKRAQFLVLGLARRFWTIFPFLEKNCPIACCISAYIAARIFADVAQGKWRPIFP